MILYVSRQVFYAQWPSNSGWGQHSILYQGCMKLDLHFLPLSLQLIQHFSSNRCIKGAVLKLLSKIFVGHDWTSNRTSTALCNYSQNCSRAKPILNHCISN